MRMLLPTGQQILVVHHVAILEVIKPSSTALIFCTEGRALSLWSAKAAQTRGGGWVCGLRGIQRLTPARPPPLARPVHLHPFCVHTPALFLPQVALHGRVIPRSLTPGEVGCRRAIDVAVQQGLLLLQLAEGRTCRCMEQCPTVLRGQLQALSLETGTRPSHPRWRGSDRPMNLGSSELAESSGPALQLSGLIPGLRPASYVPGQGRADSTVAHWPTGTVHSPGAAEGRLSAGRSLSEHSHAPVHTLAVQPSLHHSGSPSLCVGLKHDHPPRCMKNSDLDNHCLCRVPTVCPGFDTCLTS